MNKVILVGRFVRDPELKQTTNGQSTVTVTLAVKDGSNKAEFIDVVAFDKTAENTVRYCKKGSKVVAFGSLKIDSYESQGVKKKYPKVIAQNIEFLDSKEDSVADVPTTTSTMQEVYDDEDIPF